MKKIKIDLYKDLNEIITDKIIVDCSFGPNYEICILAVNEIPQRINNMFVPSITEQTRDYLAIILKDDDIKKIEILNQKMNFHFFQIIDESEILLACARSYYKNKNNIEQNGIVFDYFGNKLRAFCLGDGIADLKISSNKTIWTSYFDEGVFGNYGWAEPLGQSGLNAWDINGNIIYKYPQEDEHFISDCYAMNILDNDKVLAYYYTDFELALIENMKNINYYKSKVTSATAVAFNYNYVWFQKSFSNKFTICKINSHNSMTKIEEISFKNEKGKNFSTNKLFSNCKGSKIVFLDNLNVYIFDININNIS